MSHHIYDGDGDHDVVSDPDPTGVHTPGELAHALDVLRRARRLSYSDLEKAARPDRMPASTMSDLLKKGRPSVETLEVFLRACGVPRERHRRWLAARERALSTDLPRAAGAIRVEQASPRLLGVHKPIAVPGASEEMPVYVPRDTDIAEDGIRDLLAKAMAKGGVVVLVGESSSGKTRCAFEAVRALMPAWWLVHPAGPAQLAELAVDPPTRVVVWLDELQTYFDGERGLTPAVLRTMVSAGAVLVGTLWPERYAAYIRLPERGKPDLCQEKREVLKAAEVAHIAPVLSAAERERARQAAKADTRIAVALKSADYGMTQVMAAAPQLVDRWHTADPYARAVLAAAVDAARLGVRAPLTAEMLRAAAPGYCDARQRAAAPANWFEAALAYTTEQVHGAAAALAPVAEQMGQLPAGYVLADYLLQYAGRQRRTAKIPATTWQALVDHVTDHADQARLGHSAISRLLYRYAEPLLSNAADAGHEDATYWLALLLASQRRVEELRVRADASDGAAAERLAELLAVQGRIEEALTLWRTSADVGNKFAAQQLASLLASQGNVQELRARADAGDGAAVISVVGLLAAQGHLEEALALAHARAAAGDEDAVELLAGLLAELLVVRGRVEELRARADAGDGAAICRLAELLASQGRTEEALAPLRVRADAGDRSIAVRLAKLLAEQGRVEELCARADAGDRAAANRLAEVLAEEGRVEELRARVDAGDGFAAERLANALERWGRVEEAEQVRRFGLSAEE
ncbi:hypothetical protein ACIBQX_49145 [Nonomuraea sp. NPDC049714]|uniref:hypothetical protein n=1 Tax=Nonomuraea sp. NPDC049714 TaxID=3364357 RepID=UPI0037B2296A